MTVHVGNIDRGFVDGSFYFLDDFAVLLTHGSLKEAESLTHHLLGALATLLDIPATFCDDLLHIVGKRLPSRPDDGKSVMESAEHAAREAGLQGKVKACRSIITACRSRRSATSNGAHYLRTR